MRIIEKTDNVIKLRGIYEIDLILLNIILFLSFPYLFYVTPKWFAQFPLIVSIITSPFFLYPCWVLFIIGVVEIINEISVVNITIDKHEIKYSKKSLIKSELKIINSKDVSNVIIKIKPAYFIAKVILLIENKEFSMDFNRFIAEESANTLATFLGVPLENITVYK